MVCSDLLLVCVWWLNRVGRIEIGSGWWCECLIILLVWIMLFRLCRVSGLVWVGMMRWLVVVSVLIISRLRVGV